MYCLNFRIGLLFRENLAKKSYELRYFFMDDQATIFYIANLPRLQKVIRLSKDIKEIKTQLLKTGQKSFNLINYNITAPKPYLTQSVLPFCNRTCIEIREKDLKVAEKTTQKTAYMMLGLMDQDTMAIYDEIMHLTGKKKKDLPKRKSIQQKIDNFAEEKVFESYIECSLNFSMRGQVAADSQYDGQQISGKADGKGKQILVSKGMTYSGGFKQGKKHGRGYLVNKNLDTLECEFLEDQLTGI